jgi:mersacidin/lichenicidin family type 2 lantibiotic
MLREMIVRAWKSEEYRLGLSDADRAAIPAHPAGVIELDEAALGAVAGGACPKPTASYGCCNFTPVIRYPKTNTRPVCTCMSKLTSVWPVVLLLAAFGGTSVRADTVDIDHTIRHANGRWEQLSDIERYAGYPGAIGSVATAGNTGTGELHVLGVANYRVVHTIRHSNGGWDAFGDVMQQAGNPGAIVDVKAATIAGSLHVAVVTSGGKVWHTIRHIDGRWDPFGDVFPGQSGIFFTHAALGGNNPNGDLHVALATSDGRLFHTIRHADGGWDRLGDVLGQTGNPGFISQISIALIANDLHVLAIRSGYLLHTIRHANGGWDRFSDVGTYAGYPGAFGSVAVAGNSGTGELHILGVAGRRVFHTIRHPNGGWDRFGDVLAQTGANIPFEIGGAFVGDDLHMTVTSYVVG